jgi:predicted metal-dependent hydrolase
MNALRYLSHYPESVKAQVRRMVESKTLGRYLLGRHPHAHEIRSDRALYDYAVAIKNETMRNAAPLSKVCFDGKINVIHNALGTHTYAARVQGGRIKTKNEIRVATLFKNVPEPFLQMIVVHELAHFRHKEHDKAFYRLCEHMEPDYHRLEFELRLYLIHRELFGPLYG